MHTEHADGDRPPSLAAYEFHGCRDDHRRPEDGLRDQSLVRRQQSEHTAPVLSSAIIVLPSCTFMHGQGERPGLLGTAM